MSRIVHFEIGAVDTEKIKKFYTEVFGWKITTWGGPMEYMVISTGDKNSPGIDGGIFKSKAEALIVNTISVDNVDSMMQKVEANGGTPALPKMAVPGIGWLCYFKDVEGNLFGMMQPDTDAK